MDLMVHHLQQKGSLPFLDVPLKKKNATLKFSHLSTDMSPLPYQNEKKVQDSDSKAEHNMGLSEDPLWKHIFKEVIHIMGLFSDLKIWEIQLGEISPHDQEVDLYCLTKDSAQFAQQYNIIILGCIKNYFPRIKELKIKNRS